MQFSKNPGLEKQIQILAQQGDANRFQQTSVPICKNRRLFITSHGLLGIGSDNVRLDDIVTVISGADVPFVLRPISPIINASELDDLGFDG